MSGKYFFLIPKVSLIIFISDEILVSTLFLMFCQNSYMVYTFNEKIQLTRINIRKKKIYICNDI